MAINERSYLDWGSFAVDNIPSTLSLYPILYEYIEPGSPIIDIGCGEGTISLDLLAKGYGPTLGIDINDEGIERANQNLLKRPEEQRERGRFQRLDALNTGLDEHSFRCGIMQAFLTTLTTPQHRSAALHEARRVIHPKGGLYIAEFMQTWYNPMYYERYVKGERETGKKGSFLARDPESGEILYQSHHFSEKELVDLLLEAGFGIHSWAYERFQTRTGNIITGAIIWAGRP